MVRKLSCLLVLVFCTTGAAWGGDVASMVNLGFSEQSDSFAFAQYGIQEDTLLPYADMFIVDVERNRFVSDGVQSFVGNDIVAPGYDGASALYSLLRAYKAALEQNIIRSTNTGRLIYVLMDGDDPREQLQFRDFERNVTYGVHLVQSSQGENADTESRFHLVVSMTKEDGTAQEFIVGAPEYDRKGVLRYRIHQVIVSPDEQSMIFVMEKEEYADSGVDIRYMVETTRLP